MFPHWNVRFSISPLCSVMLFARVEIGGFAVWLFVHDTPVNVIGFPVTWENCVRRSPLELSVCLWQ